MAELLADGCAVCVLVGVDTVDADTAAVGDTVAAPVLAGDEDGALLLDTAAEGDVVGTEELVGVPVLDAVGGAECVVLTVGAELLLGWAVVEVDELGVTRGVGSADTEAEDEAVTAAVTLLDCDGVAAAVTVALGLDEGVDKALLEGVDKALELGVPEDAGVLVTVGSGVLTGVPVCDGVPVGVTAEDGVGVNVTGVTLGVGRGVGKLLIAAGSGVADTAGGDHGAGKQPCDGPTPASPHRGKARVPVD